MPLKIHVWSDVACPWCLVGERRLMTAAKNLGTDVELEWHSFELDPRPVSPKKTTDYVDYLANKYGRSRAHAQSMIDNMTAVGLEEGIVFDFAKAIIANTFDAHRLLKWVGRAHPGKQTVLAMALFEAHLCEGRDLNDRTVLASVAGAAGLDVDQAAAILSSDDFSHDVKQDEASAREMGITGVPFYAIGQYGVGGAQRPETFEKVLQRALKDAELAEGAALEEGAMCGPEGC